MITYAQNDRNPGNKEEENEEEDEEEDERKKDRTGQPRIEKFDQDLEGEQ